jgi:hypothetical protein
VGSLTTLATFMNYTAIDDDDCTGDQGRTPKVLP